MGLDPNHDRDLRDSIQIATVTSYTESIQVSAHLWN